METAIEPRDRRELIISDTPYEQIKVIWDRERFALVHELKTKDWLLPETHVTILNSREANQLAIFIFSFHYRENPDGEKD